MTTISLTLTDQELELLRSAMNHQCADFITQTVDMSKDKVEKDTYERLYDKSCKLRDKVYQVAWPETIN